MSKVIRVNPAWLIPVFGGMLTLVSALEAQAGPIPFELTKGQEIRARVGGEGREFILPQVPKGSHQITLWSGDVELTVTDQSGTQVGQLTRLGSSLNFMLDAAQALKVTAIPGGESETALVAQIPASIGELPSTQGKPPTRLRFQPGASAGGFQKPAGVWEVMALTKANQTIKIRAQEVEISLYLGDKRVAEGKGILTYRIPAGSGKPDYRIRLKGPATSVMVEIGGG